MNKQYAVVPITYDVTTQLQNLPANKPGFVLVFNNSYSYF